MPLGFTVYPAELTQSVSTHDATTFFSWSLLAPICQIALGFKPPSSPLGVSSPPRSQFCLAFGTWLGTVCLFSRLVPQWVSSTHLGSPRPPSVQWVTGTQHIADVLEPKGKENGLGKRYGEPCLRKVGTSLRLLMQAHTGRT